MSDLSGFPGVSNVVSVNAGYGVTSKNQNNLLDVTASGGDVTISLAAVATLSNGFRLSIMRNDGSDSDVIINPDGAETINGATSYILTGDYESVEIIGDGSEWFIIVWGVKDEDDMASDSAVHLATQQSIKTYVESALDFEIDYFFNDTASDIGGIYYDMTDNDLGGGESTLTTAGLGTGDDQALVNFATLSGEPNMNTLVAGIYHVHFHAEKTAGTKPLNIYYEIYKRTVAPAETLLATSEISGAITAKTKVDLHAVISLDEELNTTDRIIVKFYANVGVTGSAVTVALYQEGSSDSHLTLKAPSSILSNIFVRQDGTTPLTANWDVGGYDLTNIGVLFLTEQVAAEADVAGRGQFWVKDDAPNIPMFTDDAGNDFHLLGWSLISETELSSDTASVTFSSIPATYRNLVVVAQMRGTGATELQTTQLTVNSDGGANYDHHRWYVVGDNAAPASIAIRASTIFNTGLCEGGNSRASSYSSFILEIPGYKETDREKYFHSRWMAYGNVSSDSDMYTGRHSGRWRSTSAITSLTLLVSGVSDLADGCIFQLYGIK